VNSYDIIIVSHYRKGRIPFGANYARKKTIKQYYQIFVRVMNQEESQIQRFIGQQVLREEREKN
jgi:hypothetical protein